MRPLRLSVILIVLGTGTLFSDGTQPPGLGSSGDPYQVSTLDHLLWISTNSSSWSSYFEQTTNINASSTSGWNSGDGWSAIGNSTTKFTGSYNGQGHAISGLTINRAATDYQGLFGYANGSTIQSLGVTSVTIAGGNRTGALIGYKNGGTVSNCYTDGVITGSNYTGALVGYNYGGTVSNCYSSGSVSAGGTSSGIGGLAGYLYGTMSNCYSTASASGYTEVGGLVGNNYYGTVSNCYSTGSVSGAGTAGGLVGYNSYTATVTNSYSRASVTRSSGSFSDFGGFAGNNDTNAKIEYCYSTGSVDCGGATNKGFVGSNSGTCAADFFDYEASGQASDWGATAKTTAEMKTHSTFTDAGWDFELETANGTNDYWDMDYSGTINNGYPFLSWQNGSDVSLPVELSFFSARIERQSVVLVWATESEVDNLGFILERSEDGESWSPISSYETHDALKGSGNASSRTEYEFTDGNVEFGKEYYYRLSDENTQGGITVHEPLIIKLDALPKKMTMENTYPNPFNPRTYITYQLAEGTDINISVFDMLGRLVKELYKGHQSAGNYHVYWNGTDKDGLKVSSEPYIIRMQTKDEIQVQKVMFLK